MKEAAKVVEHSDTTPHYQGHRERLRARLFEHGPAALQDYELLEVLLGNAIPRRDVKPLAKALIAEFGGLWPLFNASAERLQSLDLMQHGIKSLSESTIALLLTVGAVTQRAQKNEILARPLLNSWQKIATYCQTAMAHEAVEQLRVLFLDRRNQLMRDEIMQQGTIDHTPAYPREIVKRALELGAGAIVLAHNHPSGDPTPSRADIEMTRAVAEACKTMDIALHDHLIIGHGKVVSFKSQGLL